LSDHSVVCFLLCLVCPIAIEMVTLLKLALNQDVRRLHVGLLHSVIYKMYCVELLSDVLLLVWHEALLVGVQGENH
jgi:hypothetical protein